MKITAVVIVLVGLFVLLVPALSVAHWSGHTDLEVQFLVTDFETGQPIPHATVHIVELEEGPADVQPASFSLTTDQNGDARRMLKNCSWGGRSGLLEDTFSVYLPYWMYHASSAGYANSQDSLLHQPEIASTVKRGPPFATVLVPIQIKKAE